MSYVLENLDQSFYETVLDALNDGVYFVNRKRRVLYWNKGAERLSGFSAKEVLGKSCADQTLNHVDDQGRCLCVKGCPLASCMRDGISREVNVYMHHKEGHRIPVSIRSFPIRDKAGKITGSVEVFKDNSQHLSMVTEFETLQQEVLTDPLSGVGNRRFADLSLERLQSRFEEEQGQYGVILADIDNFKNINDTWGHPVGDRVIKAIARTLASILRPTDIVCRLGGDEFLILLPNASVAGVEIVGNRLDMLIKESWINLGDELLSFSCSIGAAHSSTCRTTVIAVDQADKQLYMSKGNGRGCFYMNDKRVCSSTAA
ncbi:sensor domain-containing diguanylate cyclase [uncultured Cohaesibacter sp.]|uniref:sensor domain-containing diguanylate cyclase n=1 Tax=uncultured Cohaesibacter sp. TaxID=1002546 RepID=UPI0029C91CFD|nr:sensor domain-containing diguanylate cyclase [uncultured Cohaesibacter sp.]